MSQTFEASRAASSPARDFTRIPRLLGLFRSLESLWRGRGWNEKFKNFEGSEKLEMFGTVEVFEELEILGPREA